MTVEVGLGHLHELAEDRAVGVILGVFDEADPIGRSVEQRDGYYEKPEPVYAGIRVVNEPAGSADRQEMGHFGPGKWKNNEQLWWTGPCCKPKAAAGSAV